jgi:hypothetical protein
MDALPVLLPPRTNRLEATACTGARDVQMQPRRADRRQRPIGAEVLQARFRAALAWHRGETIRLARAHEPREIHWRPDGAASPCDVHGACVTTLREAYPSPRRCIFRPALASPVRRSSRPNARAWARTPRAAWTCIACSNVLCAELQGDQWYASALCVPFRLSVGRWSFRTLQWHPSAVLAVRSRASTRLSGCRSLPIGCRRQEGPFGQRAMSLLACAVPSSLKPSLTALHQVRRPRAQSMCTFRG